jgi:hypothetical protein
LRVDVVVPWRSGCPFREAAWRWVRSWWAETHPEWRVVEAPAPDGDWVKASAVNPAARASTADVVVVADADVVSPGVAEAAQKVVGGAPWAIPHLAVRRLTRDATASLLAGSDLDSLTECVEERPYEGVAGGGLIVAPRSTLVDVGLDPRFNGWGGEDFALGWALATLVGEPWRGEADLIHLWHPPQPRETRKVGSKESELLRRQFSAARGDRVAMRALVEAGKAVSGGERAHRASPQGLPGDPSQPRRSG